MKLTDEMRMILAIEAVWLLVGILLTGITTASLLLWMTLGWVVWSAWSGKLIGTFSAGWLLEKVRPYLPKRGPDSYDGM